MRVLSPDHVHDLPGRRIDNQDHVIEHYDLIALEYGIDLHDLGRRIVKLDGVRNPGSDPDREIHVCAMVAMNCGVANQDAVNPSPLLARNAGEAAASGAGAACGFIAASPAHPGFPASGFLALSSTVLTLRSGAPLAFALFAVALKLTCPATFTVLSCLVFAAAMLGLLAMLLVTVVLR